MKRRGGESREGRGCTYVLTVSGLISCAFYKGIFYLLVCMYVRAYVCVLQMLLMSLVSCQSSRQDSCSPSVLPFPPHPHTIASVACSLLKKPWTESGSTQQQKEAIATMLKCVGVGAVGGEGEGRTYCNPVLAQHREVCHAPLHHSLS